MNRKKTIFILAVVLAVAAGFGLYVQEHGIVDTSGGNIGISAGQAILIEGDTGRVLYEKCADQKAYPASTTKIMTALVTLEVLERYDSPIAVSYTHLTLPTKA